MTIENIKRTSIRNMRSHNYAQISTLDIFCRLRLRVISGVAGNHNNFNNEQFYRSTFFSKEAQLRLHSTISTTTPKCSDNRTIINLLKDVFVHVFKINSYFDTSQFFSQYNNIIYKSLRIC